MPIHIDGVQRIELHTRSCNAKSFIQRYRDINTFDAYCKACPIYGNSWACPPFAPASQVDFSPYQWVTLLGFQTFISRPYRHPVDSPEALQARSEGVMHNVRNHLDPLLITLERSLPSSRIFLPGSCQLCDDSACTRIVNAPCRYPDRMRNSLEAVGFNITLAATELLHIRLLWPKNLQMPRYLTLLSAIFHSSASEALNLSSILTWIKRIAN